MIAINVQMPRLTTYQKHMHFNIHGKKSHPKISRKNTPGGTQTDKAKYVASLFTLQIVGK